MSANVYECMFLLDTNKIAGDEAGTIKQLQGLVERNHGEVLSSRRWLESSKLAYPVQGQKRGLYVLTYFRCEGQYMSDLETDFRLNETVLRFMITKIEPKFVDRMLPIGQEGGPTFLVTVNEPPLEDTLMGGEEERRGRRPRREFADKEG
ncbi:MAG: 30S ribosomal protein S6 [Planctomycetia bacterium]|nr:30S ribosomal protein S6 [Planctomycetia bacterium]